MADVAAARPEKPDETRYKTDLEKAEKEHQAAQTKFNAAKAKVDDARSGRAGGGNDRWKQLVDEQKDIRTKQSSFKASRTEQQDQYKQNEAAIKKLIDQQKDSRGRVGYKDEKEIDEKIARLMKEVDSGSLSIVDEKKNLAEVSSLRRLKKSFGGLEDLSKKIDDKKKENTALKKTFDNEEARSLAEKYESNQKELDEIKASRDNKSKGFETLKAEREEAYAAQQEKFKAIRTLKDNYYGQKKAHKEHEDKIYQQRRERQKTERDAYEKEKRRKIAEERLQEASSPAFLDEILTAEGLIRHFDPSYSTAESDKGPSAYAASAGRTIDDSAFKGMKVVKKDEEDFFAGAGNKKKGKKGGKAAPAASSLNLNFGIIEQLGKVGVDAPSTQDDVPGVVEKLKAKVESWKKDQKTQTQKNIDKAQQDIARLEKEAAEESSAVPAKTGRRTDRAKKVAQNSAGADGEAQAEQENDAAADVSEDLKAASIEDSKTPEVATE